MGDVLGGAVHDGLTRLRPSHAIGGGSHPLCLLSSARIVGSFSRQGLIDQLSSGYGSQFPVEDATFAVDSLNWDWNEQATKKGQSYLDFMAFSCRGLIDQLSSPYGSQFTIEQATYGATALGLC